MVYGLLSYTFFRGGILQHVREVMNLFAIRTRLQGKTLPWSIQQVRNYKKTIEKLHKEKPALLQGSNVLVRVDFNVPFKNKDGKNISDDTRIREALPTIKFLSNAGAKMRMAPMAQRLSELLDGKPVGTVKDCIGPEVEKAEKNESSFAKKLVADTNANVYVNDAFGTAHRAHATTAGVSPFVDHRVAGYLLEKEIAFLKASVDTPKRPFAAIIGGAKVSTKITVIESLLQKCDKIFLGGGMIFTFYKALGYNKAKLKGVSLELPIDVVVSKECAAGSVHHTTKASDIPEDFMGLDIGAQTIEHFQKELNGCQTVVWNGPMGVFEIDEYAKGTYAVAQALADITTNGGVTIIGGGDSVAAINSAGLASKVSHISTGGGASLEMLEGKVLPGVACLDDA
eukprot:GSChrysophyteH1.ASY1.ANO1.1172.1 assembled CDS